MEPPHITIDESKFASLEWNELTVQLNEKLVDAIVNLGWHHPTPVQATCIPFFLQSNDVFVEAVTGSGKTLAFIIPLLQNLMNGQSLQLKDIGGLIISPTRELAKQIYDVLVSLIMELKISFTHILITGGSCLDNDIENLQSKGCNIIVSTPGRLADIFVHKSPLFNLSAYARSLEILIMDEGDKLLEFGFEQSLNVILSHIPKQRKTGLFSATQSEHLEKIIKIGLRNPVYLHVLSIGSKTPASLSNFYTVCPLEAKFDFLLNFLQQNLSQIKAIVFFSTCASVNHFGLALQELISDIPVKSLHGRMRERRYRIFDEFRELKKGILLCTDIMSRGIDIPDVDWVIQFDPPSSASSFVHRCGRTARQGHKGCALLILSPHEESYVNFLERNQKVTLHLLPQKIQFTISAVEHLQKMSIVDRDRFDKANRAFVSFIQSYRKHECNLIFRLKDLNFGKLATCFGLLKVPRMPELNNVIISPNDFNPPQVDILKIPYKDKQHEKFRQQQIKLWEEKGIWPSKRKHEKVNLKLKFKKLSNNIKKHQRKCQKHEFSEDDLNEIMRDAALLKKLKKKKISKEKFDDLFLKMKK